VQAIIAAQGLATPQAIPRLHRCHPIEHREEKTETVWHY
jgi:hypothetical protein